MENQIEKCSFIYIYIYIKDNSRAARNLIRMSETIAKQNILSTFNFLSSRQNFLNLNRGNY